MPRQRQVIFEQVQHERVSPVVQMRARLWRQRVGRATVVFMRRQRRAQIVQPRDQRLLQRQQLGRLFARTQGDEAPVPARAQLQIER